MRLETDPTVALTECWGGDASKAMLFVYELGARRLAELVGALGDYPVPRCAAQAFDRSPHHLKSLPQTTLSGFGHRASNSHTRQPLA